MIMLLKAISSSHDTFLVRFGGLMMDHNASSFVATLCGRVQIVVTM